MQDALRIIHKDSGRFGGSNSSVRRRWGWSRGLWTFMLACSQLGKKKTTGEIRGGYRLGRGTREPSVMLEMLYHVLTKWWVGINVKGFPGGSDGKDPAHKAGDSASILGQEDPLEKGMANHSRKMLEMFYHIVTKWWVHECLHMLFLKAQAVYLSSAPYFLPYCMSIIQPHTHTKNFTLATSSKIRSLSSPQKSSWHPTPP